MTLSRRLAVLTVFLIAGMPQIARAVSLLNSGTTPLVMYGLTFSVTGCQVGANSATGATHACVAGDNLQLLPVSTGRGTITFEVIGTGVNPALAETLVGNYQSNLSFSISAALTSPYPNNTSKATSAELTAVGYEKFSSCTKNCTGDQAHASAALSGGPGTLTANLAIQTTRQTLQTVNSSTNNFTTPSNAFTITESLNLTNTNDGLGALRLNYVTLTLRTIPEPASIAVLALALGGLSLARRRRAS